MNTSPHAPVSAGWPLVRAGGRRQGATHALRALRPLIESASPTDLEAVVQRFSDELGALRHVLGIIERRRHGHAQRWRCEDEPGWWEAFRAEFRPLIAARGAGRRIRAVRRALDDAHYLPTHEALRRLDAHSALFLSAETARPGSVVACFGLLFARGSAAGRAEAYEQLAVLCHHAASLVLDTYLRLPTSPAPQPPRLSAREAECLRWASVGKTSWETARILGVCERTVNFHLGNAFVKLNVNNKQAAVAQAILQGLL